MYTEPADTTFRGINEKMIRELNGDLTGICSKGDAYICYLSVH